MDYLACGYIKTTTAQLSQCIFILAHNIFTTSVLGPYQPPLPMRFCHPEARTDVPPLARTCRPVRTLPHAGDTAWGKAQPRPTEPQDRNDLLNPTFILSPYLVRTVS